MSSGASNVFGSDLRAALVAMVRKRVPEREVEDIVQATLTDAIESPHAPTDSDSLRRWIFGVAKNKVVDYHRRAGRETFELPEVAGTAAPHTEADLLRWAEKHLPPGDENKATLDWMLREGEGEKLEWIADDANVPAPRVRQRVSRLRRHLKTHWQKEVALLAALGILVTGLLLYLRPKTPNGPNGPEIANEDVPRAEEMRKQAFEKCLSGSYQPCLEKLDEAKKLDPAGDTQPAVQQARDNANKAIKLPPPAPSPTTSDTKPEPPPAFKDSPKPTPTSMPPIPTSDPPTPTPMPSSSFAPPKPMPKKASMSKSIAPADVFDGQKSSPVKKKTSPAKPTPSPKSFNDSDMSGSSL